MEQIIGYIMLGLVIPSFLAVREWQSYENSPHRNSHAVSGFLEGLVVDFYIGLVIGGIALIS